MVQWELLDLDEAIKQLHEHLQCAQKRINSQDDMKRSETSFKVGCGISSSYGHITNNLQ